jgi:hypothetical protein
MKAYESHEEYRHEASYILELRRPAVDPQLLVGDRRYLGGRWGEWRAQLWRYGERRQRDWGNFDCGRCRREHFRDDR